MRKIILSFVICTYNRCEDLSLVLDDLRQQIINYADKLQNNFEFEVIVVDNNSSDNTKGVVSKFTDIEPQIFKYTFELQQGLSYARNHALKLCSSDFLCFIDDDVRLKDNFILQLCHSILSLDNPLYAKIVAGMCIKPVWELSKPKWLKLTAPFNLMHSVFPVHDWGEEHKAYPFRHNGIRVTNPIGASFLISAYAYEELDGFSEYLGVGTKHGYKLFEDSLLFREAQKKNIKTYYWGSVINYHPVSPSRANIKYIKEWYFNSGKTFIWLAHNKPEFFSSPKHALFVGCPAIIANLLPSICSKLRINKIPIYLFFKLGILQIFQILGFVFFKRDFNVWLGANIAKTKGEISGFQSISLL